VIADSDVDITAQLDARPERGTDPRRHRAALAELARRMVEAPRSVLPRLVELAQDLTGAESAGISVEEELGGRPGVFRWRDLTGRFAPFVGSTVPRAGSPYGVALDFNRPIPMIRPERAFPELELGSPIGEVLMVPCTWTWARRWAPCGWSTTRTASSSTAATRAPCRSWRPSAASPTASPRTRRRRRWSRPS